MELPQDPGVSITKELLKETFHLGLDQTTVDEGDTLTYTLSVTNVGNTWLSAVSVVDPKLENVTCSPDLAESGSRFVAGAETIVCTGSVSVDQAMINDGFFESESRVSLPLRDNCFNLPPGVREFRRHTSHDGMFRVVSRSKTTFVAGKRLNQSSVRTNANISYTHDGWMAFKIDKINTVDDQVEASGWNARFQLWTER